MTSGSPSKPSRPARPTHLSPAPLERGRALGLLAGLLAFAAGFALAGAMVLVDRGGTPPYLSGICLGLVGMGLVGFFYHRGSVALPQARLWSPVLLRVVVAPLGLPVVPVIALLYLLGAVGVIGNVIVPLTRR
ncbi:MAG TPA: hypothetical protein VI248_28980 [Kineosporiaceae bacterium]